MSSYLKVKPVHRIKTYTIQCQKPVIRRNRPFVFQQKAEKHGSILQCVGRWQTPSAALAMVLLAVSSAAHGDGLPRAEDSGEPMRGGRAS